MVRAMRSTLVFFFQAEDGIRDSVASRGLGEGYKRQGLQESWGMSLKKKKKIIKKKKKKKPGPRHVLRSRAFT